MLQDGATDLPLLNKNPATCATNNQQCGGEQGLYNGPKSCCDPSVSCVWLNKCVRLLSAYYVSRRSGSRMADRMHGAEVRWYARNNAGGARGWQVL